MDNIPQYRNELASLLSTRLLPDERRRAMKLFDRALTDLSRYVLNAELEELREMAYEKADLDEEADFAELEA